MLSLQLFSNDWTDFTLKKRKAEKTQKLAESKRSESNRMSAFAHKETFVASNQRNYIYICTTLLCALIWIYGMKVCGRIWSLQLTDLLGWNTSFLMLPMNDFGHIQLEVLYLNVWNILYFLKQRPIKIAYFKFVRVKTISMITE